MLALDFQGLSLLRCETDGHPSPLPGTGSRADLELAQKEVPAEGKSPARKVTRAAILFR